MLGVTTALLGQTSVLAMRDREKEKESTYMNKSRVGSLSLETVVGEQLPSSSLGSHHPGYLPGPSHGSQMSDSSIHSVH